jgi:hypothetical protein
MCGGGIRRRACRGRFVRMDRLFGLLVQTVANWVVPQVIGRARRIKLERHCLLGLLGSRNDILAGGLIDIEEYARLRFADRRAVQVDARLQSGAEHLRHRRRCVAKGRNCGAETLSSRRYPFKRTHRVTKRCVRVRPGRTKIAAASSAVLRECTARRRDSESF